MFWVGGVRRTRPAAAHGDLQFIMKQKASLYIAYYQIGHSNVDLFTLLSRDSACWRGSRA